MGQRFLVEIRCDSPPFRAPEGRCFPEPELAFILINLAAKITSWGTIPAEGQPVDLTDSQGNHVGYARLERNGEAVIFRTLPCRKSLIKG
jgi:hypothetical protein